LSDEQRRALERRARADSVPHQTTAARTAGNARLTA